MPNSAASIRKCLEEFARACRGFGLRLTPQRIEIFRELAAADDHPTAELIYQRLLLRMPTLSLDTVYRTLSTFAEFRLIKKVETVESQARFEVVIMPHHHLICSKCNKILDFQWKEIDTVPLPETVRGWGRADDRNIVVYGVCKDCLG